MWHWCPSKFFIVNIKYWPGPTLWHMLARWPSKVLYCCWLTTYHQILTSKNSLEVRDIMLPIMRKLSSNFLQSLGFKVVSGLFVISLHLHNSPVCELWGLNTEKTLTTNHQRLCICNITKETRYWDNFNQEKVPTVWSPQDRRIIDPMAGGGLI